MVGQKLLTQFHTFLKKVKATDDLTPFAALNILFVGDFMQLPAVLDPALYVPDKLCCIYSQHFTANNAHMTKGLKRKSTPTSINTRSVTNITRRNLWLSVNHVIILKKQMRQLNDPLYADILESMR
ncbi:hypothetical protein C2G38_2015786 [Gigaspora rosea]|uniref:DNA helicase n=1 Tax=Gigaspora rosea TaxID=44941 RepID=A0A397VDV0_9GLOM|nr:hypothetical protein C2G38_2015786 [Gigaspora rosea]